MYQNPVSIIKEVIDFECSLCLEPFDQAQRYPMMLCPAQHTCCQSCVENILFNNKNANQPANCPFCKAKILKSQTVKFRLLNQIQQTALKLKAQGSRIRDSINKENVTKEQLFEALQKQKQKNEWLIAQLAQKEAVCKEKDEQLLEIHQKYMQVSEQYINFKENNNVKAKVATAKIASTVKDSKPVKMPVAAKMMKQVAKKVSDQFIRDQQFLQQYGAKAVPQNQKKSEKNDMSSKKKMVKKNIQKIDELQSKVQQKRQKIHSTLSKKRQMNKSLFSQQSEIAQKKEEYRGQEMPYTNDGPIIEQFINENSSSNNMYLNYNPQSKDFIKQEKKLTSQGSRQLKVPRPPQKVQKQQQQQISFSDFNSNLKFVNRQVEASQKSSAPSSAVNKSKKSFV